MTQTTAPRKKPAPVQTYENHARLVPLFHYVAFPILVFNFGYWVVRVLLDFSFANLVATALSVALILIFIHARAFALTVQDRVIRLEMRIRLTNLLPRDLEARVGDFSLDQLVALRFASDEELPALARKVLDEGIQGRKAIKKMITNWQADDLRA